jgi:acid phosphatase (class A)
MRETPMARPTVSLVLALALVASSAVAGSPEWETPEAKDRKTFTPYLKDEALVFNILAGPPGDGDTIAFDDAMAVLKRQKETTPERWREAEADAGRLYDRFSEAFGAKLDRTSLPFTIRLLNRLERTVGRPIFAAKDIYQRARPYQVMKLTRVCGKSAPDPDPDLSKRTSYPSGHTAYGWTAALALADLAPERAGEILARGVAYGDSRVICGAHFPSDVQAGQLMATAVYERVKTSPEFREDFACARAERTGDVARLAVCRARPLPPAG